MMIWYSLPAAPSLTISAKRLMAFFLGTDFLVYLYHTFLVKIEMGLMLRRFPRIAAPFERRPPFDQMIEVIDHDVGRSPIDLVWMLARISSKEQPSSAHLTASSAIHPRGALVILESGKVMVRFGNSSFHILDILIETRNTRRKGKSLKHGYSLLASSCGKSSSNSAILGWLVFGSSDRSFHLF